MTDANTFFDLSMFDSKGIIVMNLYDWIWSIFEEIKFVISSIIFEKDVFDWFLIHVECRNDLREVIVCQ